MAITVSTDLAAKSFLNNPINLRVTSDRNGDFNHNILSLADNGGLVRFTTNIISDSGQNLTDGDTIRFGMFTEADNLVYNDIVCSVTGIAGTASPYTIDTDAVYSTSETVTGSPQYYRENKNFEIKSTVKLKFGSGGTYTSISGPTSKTIDGINFDFDVSKYLKLLYTQNVGANETNTISLPVTAMLEVFDLPIGQIDFTEYFDDPAGLQKSGDSESTTAQYLHDGTKMPNDFRDRSLYFFEPNPQYYGLPLCNVFHGLSREYFSMDFISFYAGWVNFHYQDYGNHTVTYEKVQLTVNKKNVCKAITSKLTSSIYRIKALIYDSGGTTLKATAYFYFSEPFCPGYLVKFKNDLGGWEHLSCGLIERSIEVDKSDWEKKLTFPYTTTDYGAKNIIQRSDDILELQTGQLAYEEEIGPLFETEYVQVYDITNAKMMHGQLLENKHIIRTHDSIYAKLKIKLNRRK